MATTDQVSATRLYLGNLPRNATKQAIEEHFATHGTGEIVEVKLMNGFGFVEYKDPMDARDVVPAFHGSEFMGERLVVQFARGSRPRNENAGHERQAPRPRRTPHRMAISNLPPETSWQDLKDFARQSGLDVVYSEVGRDRDGKGYVEYETAADLRKAIEGLDNREFKGANVHCAVDDRPRERHRSRSPPRRNGPPMDDDYYRRPRGYSPRRDDYRRRSPPRDYYMDRYGGGRSPPRMRGPPPGMDDYPPRGGSGGIGRYPDDGYDPRGPPPRRYDMDPYMNGHGGRGYDRPPSPRGRPRSPMRGGYEPGYERRYW